MYTQHMYTQPLHPTPAANESKQPGVMSTYSLTARTRPGKVKTPSLAPAANSFTSLGASACTVCGPVRLSARRAYTKRANPISVMPAQCRQPMDWRNGGRDSRHAFRRVQQKHKTTKTTKTKNKNVSRHWCVGMVSAGRRVGGVPLVSRSENTSNNDSVSDMSMLMPSRNSG